MHVVFVIRQLVRGGAETQLANLAMGLAARGHRIEVVTFYPGGDDLEEVVRDAGVALHVMGKRGRWDIAGFLGRFVGLMRRLDPDVIHGYMPMSNILAVLAGAACRRARVVWGVRVSDMDLGRYDWMHRTEGRLEVALSRTVALIVANSHRGRDHCISRGFPADRVQVVHNGIETGRFARDEAGAARVRAELGLDAATPLVGLVGRLDAQKAQDVFLDAVARLKPAFPGARFVLMGPLDGAWYEARRAQATELGLDDVLVWSPRRTDMAAVYSALTVLCSASRYGEGFPNVVAEAMACACPVVATDCGDGPQVVGDAGTVVPTEDPAALADGIAAVLAMDEEARRACGEAARQRIVSRFAVETLVAASESALAALQDEDGLRSRNSRPTLTDGRPS